MSGDPKFEWPTDQLDAMNARLDFEAESDRYKILYSESVPRATEYLLSGRVYDKSSRR